MPSRVLIKPNSYHDSVSLMLLSQRLLKQPGVQDAVVAMGTDMNKELLRSVGLLTPQAEAASAADLVIAVAAASEAEAAAAIAEGELLLQERMAPERATKATAPRTISAAVRAVPQANLAFISVPGAHAARQARLALEQGLHVMLYSDNVPLEAEVRLKQLAHQKGLLLMGPDCGTAILNGVGLGFANAVRRGPIGIVAASGTGAQELSCHIDRLGSGISQIIGTGGRDLSPQVGGRMTLDGLKLLQADPETKVIMLISKPPAREVAGLVRRAAAEPGAKPTVICFLNEPGSPSIDEAAVKAVHLVTGAPEADLTARLAGEPLRVSISRGRSYVRGLFSGGTLCSQAVALLEPQLGPGHTFTDLGDDRFTAGRPHPMIDPTIRRQRLLKAAADPETAVILLDVVLGHGAHPDPAGALEGAIREAVRQGVAVVASVTGSRGDPQGLGAQVARLAGAGAHVAPTARQAALAVARALKGRE